MFATNKGADWMDWLSIAKFNYNNSIHWSTGKSLFVITHMYILKTLVFKQREGLAPAANAVAHMFHEVQEVLAKVQAWMKEFSYCSAPEYKKGQRVWLLTNHLKSNTPQKFRTKWVGPYAIKEVKPNAVKLVLSKSMRIHPVVNVKHVKPFLNPREGQRWYKPGAVYIGEDGSEDFGVKEIVDSQVYKGKLQYLIKWVGWDSELNTWEPESHLINT